MMVINIGDAFEPFVNFTNHLANRSHEIQELFTRCHFGFMCGVSVMFAVSVCDLSCGDRILFAEGISEKSTAIAVGMLTTAGGAAGCATQALIKLVRH